MAKLVLGESEVGLDGFGEGRKGGESNIWEADLDRVNGQREWLAATSRVNLRVLPLIGRVEILSHEGKDVPLYKLDQVSSGIEPLVDDIFIQGGDTENMESEYAPDSENDFRNTFIKNGWDFLSACGATETPGGVNASIKELFHLLQQRFPKYLGVEWSFPSTKDEMLQCEYDNMMQSMFKVFGAIRFQNNLAAFNQVFDQWTELMGKGVYTDLGESMDYHDESVEPMNAPQRRRKARLSRGLFQKLRGGKTLEESPSVVPLIVPTHPQGEVNVFWSRMFSVLKKRLRHAEIRGPEAVSEEWGAIDVWIGKSRARWMRVLLEGEKRIGRGGHGARDARGGREDEGGEEVDVAFDDEELSTWFEKRMDRRKGKEEVDDEKVDDEEVDDEEVDDEEVDDEEVDDEVTEGLDECGWWGDPLNQAVKDAASYQDRNEAERISQGEQYLLMRNLSDFEKWKTSGPVTNSGAYDSEVDDSEVDDSGRVMGASNVDKNKRPPLLKSRRPGKRVAREAQEAAESIAKAAEEAAAIARAAAIEKGKSEEEAEEVAEAARAVFLEEDKKADAAADVAIAADVAQVALKKSGNGKGEKVARSRPGMNPRTPFSSARSFPPRRSFRVN
ncbi:MAG: hypothetical protein WC882_06015 [Candidatus Gracilibacteria bacterium]